MDFRGKILEMQRQQSHRRDPLLFVVKIVTATRIFLSVADTLLSSLPTATELTLFPVNEHRASSFSLFHSDLCLIDFLSVDRISPA